MKVLNPFIPLTVHAIWNNSPETLRYLLKLKKPEGYHERKKHLALYLRHAVEKNVPDCAQVILEEGAHPRLKSTRFDGDPWKRSPSEALRWKYGRKKEYKEMRELFKTYGG